jgi:hypothetical protein
MLISNLTTLHLWGRTLAKYPQARSLAHADDGYIKAKMSVALQVLADLKCVLKKDAGLLNMSGTASPPPKKYLSAGCV